MAKYCTTCGVQMPDDAQACVNCGKFVVEVTENTPAWERRYCTQCGAKAEISANFCPKCGRSLAIEKKPKEDKKSVGWGILGFFIPLLGFVLYLLWRKESPLKAKSVGIGALISFCIGIVCSIVGVVLTMLGGGAEASGVFTALAAALPIL